MDEPELESRRVIFGEIRETPGIHFRELLRRHEYAQGTIQYHLRWLEDEGLVESSDDGNFTRYYPAHSFEAADKSTMNALRRTYSRRIIALLASEERLSTAALSERVGKSRSTVSWHLSRLHEEEIVEKERDGRTVLYSLRDPDQVMGLYATYQASFRDRLLDKVLDLWDVY
ncbi:transcriptional regulator [Haladaptatus sp. W1]|uniref:winged helix-turn-helix transcriptional regulator n=1 Tax=Haladaptatus sp. W1 TaxID=1897478 RepID=UPI0008499601|nr:metalloregulator ArsR/SmtB family transcription factor [Haladaptatus sp. W1]ODR79675.1 transcriptional regulator [Haladaptatus sp. W1]